MPSKLPLIAVRVQPDLYSKIRARADAEDRSISNFIARHLHDQFGRAPRKRRVSAKEPATAPA